ncbi:MAG: DUF1759 domain-containing protein [Pseudomonadota bacterium]
MYFHTIRATINIGQRSLDFCLASEWNVLPTSIKSIQNYNIFKKFLKEMFGKPRLVQQSHVKNILNLKPFETDNIKPFLTTLETSMRCLAELGIDMDNGSWIIVPFVEELMSKEILQKWREEINDDDSFSTKKLLDFLH